VALPRTARYTMSLCRPHSPAGCGLAREVMYVLAYQGHGSQAD